MFGLIMTSVLLVIAYIIIMDWQDSNYVRSIRRRKEHRRKSKIIRQISILHKAGMYETADVVLEDFYKK